MKIIKPLILLLGTTSGLRKFTTNYLYTNKVNSITRLKSKKTKNDSSFNDNKYSPKSINQFEYKSVLEKKNIDLLFCIGPAGTGKTLFACQHSIKALQDGKYKRIIITRPTVSIEEDLGFLPGTIKEKMQPYTVPIFDIFQE